MKFPTVNQQTKEFDKDDSISLLKLPHVIEKILIQKNVTTVGKFYKCKRKKLYKFKNLGKKSVHYLMKMKQTIIFNQKPNDQVLSLPKDSQSLDLTESSEVNPLVNLSKNDDLETLGLPTRWENALRNGGINSVGDLFDCSISDLRGLRNLGEKSLSLIMETKKRVKLVDEDPNAKLKTKKIIKPDLSLNRNKYLIVEQIKDKSDLRELVGIKQISNEEDKPHGFSLNGVSLTGDESIAILDLPTRLENTLRFGGIDTVKEFYDASPDDLLKLRNMGPVSLSLISDIKKTIDITDLDNVTISEILDKPNLINIPKIPNEILIDRLLERCKDLRTIEVIKRRYGLMSGDTETLEEIGKSFNITRERIRQIQEKAIRKLRHPTVNEKAQIMELVEKLLWEKGGIISEEEADQFMPGTFKNLPYDGSSLLDLLADIGWIENHEVGDVLFYSPKLNNLPLSILMTDVVQILRNNKGLLSPDSISKLMGKRGDLDDETLINLISRCCKLDPRIEEKIPNMFASYSSKKKLWITLMTNVLEEEGMPLHFTEIADRVNDLLIPDMQRLEHRRAHSILIENSPFAHTGVMGTYGLTKWGLRRESTADLIRDYIKSAGFPVHWEQIYNYVSKYKDSKKLSIKSVLDTSGKFENKGRGFYWIR